MGRIETKQSPRGHPQQVLIGSWNDEARVALGRVEKPHLVLNYALGWVGEDLNFLKNCPPLYGLSIIDLRLKDLSGVQFQSSLEVLELETYAKTPIHFDQYPSLRRAFLYWHRGAESVLAQEGLEELGISGLKQTNLCGLCRLGKLRNLWLVGGGLHSLRGIENLPLLREVLLGNLKSLSDLSALQFSTSLRKVEVRSCTNIKSFDSLHALASCEFLRIWDCKMIANLKFLDGMTALQTLDLAGNNVVSDHDLSPILELPQLESFRIRNRKNYNPDPEAIRQHLKGRRKGVGNETGE